MPSPVPASLSTILPLVQAQLASVTGLPLTRVLVTARREDAVPHYQADSDVLLRPLGERPDRAVNDGTLRYENRRFRTLRVTVRSRLYTDEADRDYQWLLDASLGHLALEDAITDALEGAFNFLTDANGNSYVYQPLRVGDWSECERERADPMWGSSACDVEVAYIRLLRGGPTPAWA